MKRFNLFMLLCIAISICTSAQIGYQVSLLNNATGEPRANERVSVTVKITDSEGKTVCEETKYETSNDFGVISMSIGNSDIFSNADWSKLPFFIEASVDSRLLGKSQLLSVPVAEYAKRTASLTKETLCSKNWTRITNSGYLSKYIFYYDGNYVYQRYRNDDSTLDAGEYCIEGNNIFLYDSSEDDAKVLFYSPSWNGIIDTYDGYIFK